MQSPARPVLTCVRMDTRRVVFEEFGGPEVLRLIEQDLSAPANHEVSVRHTAVGLNFIDVYHRTGLYPQELPSGLGREAAGVVEAIGRDVSFVAPGDRVVYTGGPLGAYATRRNIDASLVVALPVDISDEVAAAVFLKGLTAWYLLHHSFRVSAGDPILLYAAAGGVGSLVSQWARLLGAEVIGITGTAEKAKLAEDFGCGHVLLADAEDLPARVRALTGGHGVAAVYDSVGRDTFIQSLDCLRPMGTMVSFGNASGPVDPFALAELTKRGSLYVTRPTLETFVATRSQLLDAAEALFTFVRRDTTQIRIGQRFGLDDVADAHRALTARGTTGSTLLLP